MKRAALLALLVFFSFGAGCKKKAGTNVYREFRETVCMCKDLACVEKVTQQYQARANMEPRNAFPDELKKIEECMMKAAGNSLPSDAAAADLPALVEPRDADTMIAAVRAWQNDPSFAVAEVTINYVEASGRLDETHGDLSVNFSFASTPADDPNRKTGAPVVRPERPRECPSVGWLPGRGWTRFAPESCPEIERYIARCTVVEIWQRAIKLGAPNEALAVITFRNTQPPKWGFSIMDDPRDIHIAHEFPDDCERTLEKSP